MPVITIKSNIRNYNVTFGKIGNFLEYIEKNYQNTVYVIDENVWKLYSKNQLKAIPESKLIVLPIHEDKKNLTSVEWLYDNFIEKPSKRNTTIVSIGGGICQDITGFLASTLYRGIKWVFIPSTYLAQADSCIGSKTSLNYKSFKNLLGTFYPPVEVLIDPQFLTTNADQDYYSGLGEAVKLALMGGKNKTEELLKLIPQIKKKDINALEVSLTSALLIKQSYIEGDEFDSGRRNLLNYGHCFGHAIETASDFEVPHGQGVVLGMMLANKVSVKRNLMSAELEKYIFDNLLLPTLVIKVKASCLDSGKIIAGMKKDKKRTGEGLPLVMMKNGYEFERAGDITTDEASAAVNEIKSILKI